MNSAESKASAWTASAASHSITILVTDTSPLAGLFLALFLALGWTHRTPPSEESALTPPSTEVRNLRLSGTTVPD